MAIPQADHPAGAEVGFIMVAFVLSIHAVINISIPWCKEIDVVTCDAIDVDPCDVKRGLRWYIRTDRWAGSYSDLSWAGVTSMNSPFQFDSLQKENFPWSCETGWFIPSLCHSASRILSTHSKEYRICRSPWKRASLSRNGEQHTALLDGHI